MREPVLALLLLAVPMAPAGATQVIDVHAGTEDLAVEGAQPAGIADVNGDGLLDLVSFGSEIGILFGRGCFPRTLDWPHDVRIERPSKPGFYRLKLGDLNGDGIADLLVRWQTGNFSDEAVIFFGRRDWPARIDLDVTAPDVRLIDPTRSGFVTEVLIADVNADGIADAVTAPDPVRVFFGRPAWPAVIPKDAADFTVLDTGPGVGGFSLAAADVNADGMSDLVIGEPAAFRPSPLSAAPGAIAVIFGSPSNTGTRDLGVQPADVFIRGSSDTGELGTAVAAGDLDGDGFAEIVGAESNAQPFGRLASGQIQVIRVGPALPGVIDLRTDPPLATFQGRFGDQLGVAELTSFVADATGDGTNDLAFVARKSGWFVFSGPSVAGTIDLETASPDVLYFSSIDPAAVYVGLAVSGDLNGGGRNDFAVLRVIPSVAADILVYFHDAAPPPALPSGPACAPLGQGFWHRQCLSPGVGGPLAGRAPFHPRYSEEELRRFFSLVSEWLFCNGLDEAVCDALVADPASDPCEKAWKEFVALLLNIAAERLGQQCELKDSSPIATIDPARRPETVEDLLTLIPELLQAGDADSCKLARDVTNGVNSSELLLAPAPLPFSVPLGTPGRSSVLTPSSPPTSHPVPVTAQP